MFPNSYFYFFFYFLKIIFGCVSFVLIRRVFCLLKRLINYTSKVEITVQRIGWLQGINAIYKPEVWISFIFRLKQMSVCFILLSFASNPIRSMTTSVLGL